jgi:hypothetical protein
MSAFTALNGGSPKAMELHAESVKVPGAASDRPNEPAPAQSHSSPEVTITQKDSAGPESEHQAMYQSTSYPRVGSPVKRKRSNSVEARQEAAFRDRTPETATTQTHAEAYGTPQRDYRQYGDEPRDRDSWHSQHGRDDRNPYDTQQNSATSAHSHTEEQIGEALRRAHAHANATDSDWANASPEAEDASMTYGGSYGGDSRQDPMLQHDPKKRKRNFSNRTKTGCLTCRKRKKKCDEQKPECKTPHATV